MVILHRVKIKWGHIYEIWLAHRETSRIISIKRSSLTRKVFSCVNTFLNTYLNKNFRLQQFMGFKTYFLSLVYICNFNTNCIHISHCDLIFSVCMLAYVYMYYGIFWKTILGVFCLFSLSFPFMDMLLTFFLENMSFDTFIIFHWQNFSYCCFSVFSTIVDNIVVNPWIQILVYISHHFLG